MRYTNRYLACTTFLSFMLYTRICLIECATSYELHALTEFRYSEQLGWREGDEGFLMMPEALFVPKVKAYVTCIIL